jgi:hydroxymethylpyrimidine pyrophosphatase-like HAD family hydrolase
MTPSAKISLLLADVDETLVTPEKVLTDRYRVAVRQLNEGEIAFALTSVRPPFGMKIPIEPLELTTPHLHYSEAIHSREQERDRFR